MVGAESVRNKAHDYVGQCTTNWRGQEAQTGLDGRNLLDILEEQCLEGLCRGECAPDDENAGANDTEYAVPPQRIGDDSWAAKFFLSTNPKDEGWDQNDTKDESTKRLWIFDLVGPF